MYYLYIVHIHYIYIIYLYAHTHILYTNSKHQYRSYLSICSLCMIDFPSVHAIKCVKILSNTRQHYVFSGDWSNTSRSTIAQSTVCFALCWGRRKLHVRLWLSCPTVTTTSTPTSNLNKVCPSGMPEPPPWDLKSSGPGTQIWRKPWL